MGIFVASTAGNTVTPLRPIALLAPRQPDSPTRDHQHVPINRTAAQASTAKVNLIRLVTAETYRLSSSGPRPFALTLSEIEALPTVDRVIPLACVEGWSVSARWIGPTRLSLVEQAGGSRRSTPHLTSVEVKTHYRPRLPDPLDRARPGRCAQPQMAQDGRDHVSAARTSRPSVLRVALGALALASIGYGRSLLFAQPKVNRPFEVIRWAIASDIVVDGGFIPASIAVGFVLTKVIPARARRFVQGALIAAVGVALVALPLTHRRGQAQPGQALLLQNYELNLFVLLGAIAGATALAYIARVIRDLRQPSADDH